MKLSYNGCDLTLLGEVALTQNRELEGGDQPQRARVRLNVKLDLFQRSYDANRQAIETLRAALALPNATLQWTNDEAGVDYVCQTATLVSEDLPEDWGEYHQVVNLVFSYYEQAPGGALNNVPLTYLKEGGSTVYTFDVVNRWQHAASTERFSPLRQHRRESRGRVRVEGQIFGDTTASLAARRAALATAAANLANALNSSQGRLRFGAGGSVFDGVVRIEEFTCDLDQLVNALTFAFTANYTRFPNELDYATAEFTVDERDPQTGELTLTVAGRIQAAHETAATVKRDALLGQVLSEREYLAGQQLDLESTANVVSANADGDTFTELNFTARYRKWRTTNLRATLAAVADGRPAQPLGNVARWGERWETGRYHPLRPQRERVLAVIETAGTWHAPTTLSLSERRATLLARVNALKAEVVAAAETRLRYGDFDQAVRVSQFNADINQAETGVEWSLSATYTVRPNEASYALADYTLAESDPYTGELRLTVTGRIQAADEPAARRKLSALLTAALTERGYHNQGQALRLETTPNRIDAEADGVTFTELQFTAEYRRWKPTNQAATFGAAPAVPLGHVSRWQDRISTSRFHPLRSLRERTTGSIEAAGTWSADPQLSVAERRAQLLDTQRKLKAAVAVPEDVLSYGDWSQRVRVTEFTAEINQAETGIEWALSAQYTLFPNEAGYATVEYTAQERDPFTGEVTLTLSGKVQAATEAAATATLGALVSTVTRARGYAGGQQVSHETTPNQAQTDEGGTFTELSFTAVWRRWKTTNQAATFAQTGSAARVLGQVTHWRDRYNAQRFTELRSQRRHATGGIEVSGTLAGDMSVALGPRRAALLAQQRALKEAVNGADGTLTYGDWSQVVRVDDFQCEINQAETGIEWSLSASYSLFPNEGGYATAEWTTGLRESVEDGDEVLTLAGTIASESASHATSKLASVRASVLASYGFSPASRLQSETGYRTVFANGDVTAGIAAAADGSAFLELSFSETFRRRRPGVVVSSTLTVSSREDLATQTLQTTYAGSVTASGANYDAAYAAALARAQALGADREGSLSPGAFLRSSTLGCEQRQLTGESPTELVRLSFTYEYQSKLSEGRVYLELSTNRQRDTFGMDTETCSGYVAAPDAARAEAVYAEQVRALYAERLIHTEQTTVGEQRQERRGEFRAQHTRLEFNLQVFLAKSVGEIGLRYSIEIARDFLTLEMRTTLQGSCFAASRSVADAAVNALVRSLKLGAVTRSRRSEDRQRDGRGREAHLKLDFTEEIVGRVIGQVGVIELRLSERVTYGGTRWAVQALPFAADGSGGISIPQPTGKEPGRRTISGSVTAATRATAETWAKRQRALLTGDRLGNRHPLPEEWEVEYVWVPRVDGIAQGAQANVQLFRVGFTFAEILPDYPAP